MEYLQQMETSYQTLAIRCFEEARGLKEASDNDKRFQFLDT